MTLQRIIEASGDEASVWIHINSLCVARFGRRAYEIHKEGDPSTILAAGRHIALDDWITFRDQVLVHHGYNIAPRRTPRCYWSDLGILPTEPVSIPLADIQRFHDPLQNPIWKRGPTDRATIAAVLAEGRLANEFVEEEARDGLDPLWDARRIAHFVVDYEPEPMELLITSDHGHFEVYDGFHRLGAAIYRGDARFNVLLEGDETGIARLFPDQAPVLSAVPFIKPGSQNMSPTPSNQNGSHAA
jgi:hypothetical protein